MSFNGRVAAPHGRRFPASPAFSHRGVDPCQGRSWRLPVPGHRVRRVKCPSRLARYMLADSPADSSSSARRTLRRWPGMATIKAIEARSVHQIQSGQVIVDLCSVVKELVENGLDAGASSIEVRLKNNGLDSIEVQDNGGGISPSNYETVALKHYTSKLSTYDDLSSLQTFGFRGEALSSLCALSHFTMVTAQADEAPKGKKLDFEVSGKLKATSIVACQKGTTATVENLFEGLPVRRKELSKNIKREYGKVIGLLHAYACVSTHVKFVVKNTMPKNKSMTVFSTNGNSTTRDNIANVYGAKTLAALVSLDLALEFRPTITQLAQKDKDTTNIRVQGHISRPVFGEGRQTPDRQMFFVNGRPCGLPQIAKAINEVYKSYNVSQSPFIFADLIMDTNSYDVNVSPDKRTILLHDAVTLIENLKSSLTEMFDQQDQTVPQSLLQPPNIKSHLQTPKLPAFRPLSVQRSTSGEEPSSSRSSVLSDASDVRDRSVSVDAPATDSEDTPKSLLRQHVQAFASRRDGSQPGGGTESPLHHALATDPGRAAQTLAEQEEDSKRKDEPSQENTQEDEDQASQDRPIKVHVRDFNRRLAEIQGREGVDESATSVSGPRIMSPPIDSDSRGVVTDAFDRMRPGRVPAEIATITVGDSTITTVLGTQMPRTRADGGAHRKLVEINRQPPKPEQQHSQTTLFSQRLRRKFAAPGADIEGDEFQEGAQRDEVGSEGSQSPATSLLQQNDTQTTSRSAETSDLYGNSDDDHTKSCREDEEGSEEADGDVSGNDERQSAQDSGLEDDSDEDYMDEAEKKEQEEARVAELIRIAEESAARPSKENIKRATKALTHSQNKDTTTSLLTTVDVSLPSLARELQRQQGFKHEAADRSSRELADDTVTAAAAPDEETRLSLTVSKSDFAKMNIVGQFNLGFILAVRPAADESGFDELFIIDQHASDEKYNFERLQAETTVGNQRLVRPAILDLTAVEEEIVLESREALEKNGFLVDIDTSGASMVGQRCRLISLPLSKEVVFGSNDLEELIQLLAEAPGLGSSNTTASIPRPTKVRKMFAMRACRSSVMVGKTLSTKQMERVVTHMGTIDKPWNCPHGRPTMRHLTRLDGIPTWTEGARADGEGLLSAGEAMQAYISDG